MEAREDLNINCRYLRRRSRELKLGNDNIPPDVLKNTADTAEVLHSFTEEDLGKSTDKMEVRFDFYNPQERQLQ